MSYTIAINDPENLIDQETEARLFRAATFVIERISAYVHWEGTMDLEVRIRENSELPGAYADIDGLLPSIVHTTWAEGEWTNWTIHEALTGTDAFPDRSDVGLTMYLGRDGTPRVYGNPIWIDPSPSAKTPPDIPPGHADFVGILFHEIFHSLGLVSHTKEWRELIEVIDGVDHFIGDRVLELLGEPLPFQSDHYGHDDLPAVVSRGLMYIWGHYVANRLDIGRLDLALLEDLGYTIKTYDGLPLVELEDDSPDITGDASDNVIWGDYQNNSLYGLAGNDRIEPGAGADSVIGGPGIDSVVFPQARDGYEIQVLDTDGLVVVGDDSDPGPNRLTEVERLKFEDINLAFDLDGHAGEAVKVLGAFYGINGANDPARVGDVLVMLDSGMSYEELIRHSLDTVFGETRDGATLVSHFFQSVVGATAPDEVVEHWAPLIDDGQMSPFDLSLIVAEHELNLANIDFVGLSESGVEYAIGAG